MKTRPVTQEAVELMTEADILEALPMLQKPAQAKIMHQKFKNWIVAVEKRLSVLEGGNPDAD